jgi:hypothetical protein
MTTFHFPLITDFYGKTADDFRQEEGFQEEREEAHPERDRSHPGFFQ